MKWLFPEDLELGNVPLNLDHILYFHKPKQDMPNLYLIEFSTARDARYAWSFDNVKVRDAEYDRILRIIQPFNS